MRRRNNRSFVTLWYSLMVRVTRGYRLASLAAIVVAGCGTSSTDVRPKTELPPPPGQQQVTLRVPEMGQRLKLF
jgi:hypothetical protein